jgi:hypothetical protein
MAHNRTAALMVRQMPKFAAGRIEVDAEQREDDWRNPAHCLSSGFVPILGDC